VADANPGREVWLIEDRAAPHKKAADVEKEVRERLGIRSCITSWPSKSPDLNMIEPTWTDLKDECHPHWRRVVGSSESARLTAKAIVEFSWRMVRERAVQNASNFLERCRNVDRRGGNNNIRG
jgi:transposase